MSCYNFLIQNRCSKINIFSLEENVSFYVLVHNLLSKYYDIFMLNNDEHKYIIYCRISFVYSTIVIFYKQTWVLTSTYYTIRHNKWLIFKLKLIKTLMVHCNTQII